MFKRALTIALIAVLGTMAVSCQKENINETTTAVSQIGTVRNMYYTIDGVNYHITLVGDEAWRIFLNQMLALAEEGHRVSFRNEDASSCVGSTKETVTYVTGNHDDAIAWADTMVDKGYDVTITFDEKEHKYVCIAVK